MCKSEDNIWEAVLAFLLRGSQELIQIVKLDSKLPYRMSHLVGPQNVLSKAYDFVLSHIHC